MHCEGSFDTEMTDWNTSTAINQFTVFIPSADFSRLLAQRLKRGLATGWTDILYKLVHEHVPTCALQFSDNRLRQAGSRQKHAAFWTGNQLRYDFFNARKVH